MTHLAPHTPQIDVNGMLAKTLLADMGARPAMAEDAAGGGKSGQGKKGKSGPMGRGEGGWGGGGVPGGRKG